MLCELDWVGYPVSCLLLCWGWFHGVWTWLSESCLHETFPERNTNIDTTHSCKRGYGLNGIPLSTKLKNKDQGSKQLSTKVQPHAYQTINQQQFCGPDLEGPGMTQVRRHP